MDYAEALKKVNTKPIADNYMIINFGYGNGYILPHKQGLTILDALNYGEIFEERYNEDCKIEPLNKGKVSVNLFSRQEYVEIKMAKLLGTTVALMNITMNAPLEEIKD